MHEGPAWQRHAGPSFFQNGESAHRLPLELCRDLLATVIDLRRLPEILVVGLQPLLPDLLNALSAKLLLLRLEGRTIGRLALVHAEHVHGVTLTDRNADGTDGQRERRAERLAHSAEGGHGARARDEPSLPHGQL